MRNDIALFSQLIIAGDFFWSLFSLLLDSSKCIWEKKERAQESNPDSPLSKYILTNSSSTSNVYMYIRVFKKNSSDWRHTNVDLCPFYVFIFSPPVSFVTVICAHIIVRLVAIVFVIIIQVLWRVWRSGTICWTDLSHWVFLLFASRKQGKNQRSRASYYVFHKFRFSIQVRWIYIPYYQLLVCSRLSAALWCSWIGMNYIVINLFMSCWYDGNHNLKWKYLGAIVYLRSNIYRY